LYQTYNFSEFLDVKDNLQTIDNYLQKPLYIYSENSDSDIEVENNLFYLSKITERIQKACLDYSSINQSKEDNCINENPDYPIKTCQDNFIIIEKSQDNSSGSLEQVENCLFIKSPSKDLVKATDEALFRIFGVK